MRIRIVTLPRSGSTYLTHIIRSNFKDHNCYLEPTAHHKIPLVVEKFSNFIKEEYDFDYKDKEFFNDTSENIIVKGMIYHGEFPKEIWHPSKCHTIKLIRNNTFEQTLSFSLAMKTRNWVQPDETQHVLDENEFLQHLNFIKRNKLLLEQFKADKTVYFEELTFDPHKDILNMGFDLKENIIPWKKMSDKRHTVINYEDLKALYIKNENVT